IKQEVMLGDANAEYVNILGGLNADDRVYLSSVRGMEKDEVNLLPEMNGKRREKEAEEPEPLQPESPRGRGQWQGRR
ncbi:MAG: RND transporter, partial [Ekhidna sp.]|nr:RND transporter [Ekhidna sp.]